MFHLHGPARAAGLFFVLAATAASPLIAQKRDLPGPAAKGGGIKLHNGWTITPAGTHAFVADMPQGGALSPDGTRLAVASGGAAAHAVYLVDTTTGRVRQTLPVTRAQSGVAWSPDGARLFVSGGNAGQVHVWTRQPDGTLAAAAPLVLPDSKTAYLSGLAVSADNNTVFVADLATNAVLALDAQTGAVRTRRALDEFARPGCVRVSPDGNVYVALWGKASVLALDPATLETKQTLKAGGHPNDLQFAREGSRLFVSCGNENAVLVLDRATGQTRERIALTLTPRAPAGATPSALALSPDGNTLFVANSDNNAVAVIDVSQPDRSRVKGFVPTAHYPTLVAVSPDNKRLFVGCGKGIGTGPNPVRLLPIDPVTATNFPYIATLLSGVISTVSLPDDARLAAYTRQVLANTPYTSDDLLLRSARAPRPGTNPVPSRVGEPSPIKHVLYIIKENRTYDQVFGDIKSGNGDPNLCLFGEEVTPNHHALAREFVLLDNLYADGEVSVDGHHWSNGAYVPDAMQRMWPAQYGGKGAPPIRYGDFGDPLAETPGGRIWDLCERANLSYRTYYYHTDKRRSEEWAAARAARTRDYVAADIFLKDLQTFEQTGALPRFMVMALSEDHTSGTRPGAFTPKASVASNDLALGKIVEACSRSRFWKEMAIFVIEDDAQNGPDHVDAHRTVALVVSPYTRRSGHVDSTFYTTTSMLRTMELILGLAPMSQYDAAAAPMYGSFTSKPDSTPFKCRPARIDLQAKNSPDAFGAQASLALDFSEPDRLTRQNEDTLNRVLWHSIRGEKTPYPGITRRALLAPSGRSLVVPARSANEEK